MDLISKAKVELLPSLVQAFIIGFFHYTAHTVAGSEEFFSKAGVMEAGVTVLLISFTVIFYYNVIGWKLNEKFFSWIGGKL